MYQYTLVEDQRDSKQYLTRTARQAEEHDITPSSRNSRPGF